MKTSLFVLASTAFNWPVTTALNVNDPKLTFTPTPNAIEDLQAHDLWYVQRRPSLSQKTYHGEALLQDNAGSPT